MVGAIGAHAVAPGGTAAQTLLTAPPPAASMAVAPYSGAVPALNVVPRLLLQSDGVLFRHGAEAPPLQDPATHPGVYLRRARLGLDVNTGLWRARVTVEAFAQPETSASGAGPTSNGASGTAATAIDPVAGPVGGGSPRATEAFVALVPHQALAVAAGSLRVPLGLSRQIDEADLRLPERARVITRGTPDYRVGLAVSGDLGLLQYSLGAYSAAARFDAEGAAFDRGGALLLFRLTGEPLGPIGLAPQLRRRDDPWYDWWRFSAGLTLFHVRLPGANESGVEGDGQFQWRRVCVTGELLWTRRDTADRVGFTVEPGLFVWPDTVEVVTRLEWFNDQVGPPSPADAWGASAGATVFTRARRVRIQAAYTWRRPLASEAAASGWAVLRATFVL